MKTIIRPPSNPLEAYTAYNDLVKVADKILTQQAQEARQRWKIMGKHLYWEIASGWYVFLVGLSLSSYLDLSEHLQFLSAILNPSALEALLEWAIIFIPVYFYLFTLVLSHKIRNRSKMRISISTLYIMVITLILMVFEWIIVSESTYNFGDFLLLDILLILLAIAFSLGLMPVLGLIFSLPDTAKKMIGIFREADFQATDDRIIIEAIFSHISSEKWKPRIIEAVSEYVSSKMQSFNTLYSFLGLLFALLPSLVFSPIMALVTIYLITITGENQTDLLNFFMSAMGMPAAFALALVVFCIIFFGGSRALAVRIRYLEILRILRSVCVLYVIERGKVNNVVNGMHDCIKACFSQINKILLSLRM